MPPPHFNVSQVRVASVCPRILYFDAVRTRQKQAAQPLVTRIWKINKGGETTACGTLFHHAIEKFNRAAIKDPSVRGLLERPGVTSADINKELLAQIYSTYVNRDALFRKTGEQQQAFLEVLRRYVEELGEILGYALKLGKPAQEILDELFGEKRRRVDVTFQVGPNNEPVHITGALDYLFYDWRTESHRIIDYKLTPAQQIDGDLFQVSIYALMHNRMHQTEPEIGVLYLYPTRELLSSPWERVYADRHMVFNLLASMREWVQFDEKTGQGLKPPGNPSCCKSCKWNRNNQCEQRLGPKHVGGRLTEAPSSQQSAEPVPVCNESGPMLPAQPTAKIAPPVTVPPSEPEKQLLLGQTADRNLAVKFPRDALPTHLAVVGAAGSGKTWLAKVLAEEAILQGIPVVAIDPQGDLVQFLRRQQQGELTEGERLRHDRYWDIVEPRVFTPGSSHGIRICLNPIRLLREHELEAIEDPVRRAEEIDNVLKTVAGNLITLAKSGGETDSQQTFLLQVLKKLSVENREINLPNLASALSDPESMGIDDSDTFVKRSERERLARKMKNLFQGVSSHLFSGGSPLDLDALRRPSRAGRVPLNIIYLNALHNDEQKQFFVASLAAEVYRWMVSAYERETTVKMLFYLDEARDFIPAGAKKPPAKEPLIRLFTQARKFGVSCLICTQSPRSVDYNVFGNCSTKMIGRLESAQDADRVKDWFTTDAPPTWLGARAAAAPGTFIARWPGMPVELEGQVFKGRALYSLHGGAWSPERVEQEMRDDPARRNREKV